MKSWFIVTIPGLANWADDGSDIAASCLNIGNNHARVLGIPNIWEFNNERSKPQQELR